MEELVLSQRVDGFHQPDLQQLTPAQVSRSHPSLGLQSHSTPGASISPTTGRLDVQSSCCSIWLPYFSRYLSLVVSLPAAPGLLEIGAVVLIGGCTLHDQAYNEAYFTWDVLQQELQQLLVSLLETPASSAFGSAAAGGGAHSNWNNSESFHTQLHMLLMWKPSNHRKQTVSGIVCFGKRKAVL